MLTQPGRELAQLARIASLHYSEVRHAGYVFRSSSPAQEWPRHDHCGGVCATALHAACGGEAVEEMLIYDFVAEPKLLASSGLMAFEGFFDVRDSKHDYDYGRSVAQPRLTQYKTLPGSIFSNLHWMPKTINPIDQNLNDIQMKQVDKTKREKVYDQISQGATDLLQELNRGIFVRKLLMWLFINGQIKKLLAL